MAWPFFLFGLAAIGLQVAIYLYGYLHGSYPAAFALGLVSWLVAGTFGHEGLHYGISRRYPWLNHVLGFYSISTIANPIIWKHQVIAVINTAMHAWVALPPKTKASKQATAPSSHAPHASRRIQKHHKQHTYSHHSFTNDHEQDPDCHHFERMLRIHAANPHNTFHRLLVHPYVKKRQSWVGAPPLLAASTNKMLNHTAFGCCCGGRRPCLAPSCSFP